MRRSRGAEGVGWLLDQGPIPARIERGHHPSTPYVRITHAQTKSPAAQIGGKSSSEPNSPRPGADNFKGRAPCSDR
jgi:hypothetical protein